MRSLNLFLACALLAICLRVPGRAAPNASLNLGIRSGQGTPNPIIEVTLRNLSMVPLHVASAGAFFDYQCRLTDVKGRAVRMTKEGMAIRNGRGVIVMSATMVDLNQNETQQENLDLARYFDLSAGGPYRLVLTRVLDSVGDRVTSNSLEIRTR